MVKRTKYTLIVLVLLLMGFILGTYYSNKNPKVIYDHIEFLKHINALDSVIFNINSKKDSIDHQIDTINIIVEKVHIEYEKDFNTILNNAIDSNYLFFIGYIRDNKERFDSINIF